MTNYWNILSDKYRLKVKVMARQNDVDTETVMRNLVGYLEKEELQHSRPEYFKEFVLVRDIEELIDMVA